MMKAIFLTWRLWFPFIFIVSISACVVHVPMMPETSDLQAKHFLPPEDKGNLYVVRPGSLIGVGMLLQIVVDGKVLGAVRSGTYLLADLTPGKHTVTVITESDSESTDLAIKKGQNFFIQVKPTWGWISSGISVKTLDAEIGRNLVQKTKRAQHIEI